MSTISATFRGKATISTTSTVSLIYNGVTSLPPSTPTTLLSYTVPVSKTFYAMRIELSGTNIAQFTMAINATVFGVKRTWYGEGLNETFDISANNDANVGVILNSGDNLTITVEHFQSYLGDFDATLVGVLSG